MEENMNQEQTPFDVLKRVNKIINVLEEEKLSVIENITVLEAALGLYRAISIGKITAISFMNLINQGIK